MSRHALAVVSALALGLSSVVPAAASASAAPGAPAPSPTGSSSPSSPAGAASTASNVSTDSTGVRVPAAVQKGVAGSVVDRTSTIRWTRCGTMQCATLTVPRDYADPSAGTIDLTVTRRPADRQGTGPEGRLGVLVTNPGGPGTAAAQTVPMFAQIVGRDVRARFDIIGINPRGTGDDQPAVCAGKPGQAMPDLLDWIFPTTAAQVRAQLASDAYNVALCRKATGNQVLSHMSTGDSARDIDAVRAALGEEQINYYGVSYGTQLGATYSQLFPSRVRTMVLDGTLDPIAWTTGRGQAATPSTTRVGSHVSGHEALLAAIAECERVGPSGCAEHATIRDDWAQLQASLKRGPITLAEDFSISYDMVIAMVNAGLYDYEGVPDVLTMIRGFNELASGKPGAVEPPPVTDPRVNAALTAYRKVVARDERNRRTRIAYDPPAPPEEEAPTPEYYAAFTGVVCADGVQPKDPQAWPRAAAAADRVAPGFGSLWTWESSVCAQWPFRSTGAFRGPFTTTNPGGMLIVNTTHDPATGYAGARAMRELRPDSRIVTVPGWGHGVLDTSGCATGVRTDYLISGNLPASDQECAQDHPLFTSLR